MIMSKWTDETLVEEVGLKMGLCFGRGFENDISAGIDGPVSSPRVDLWKLLFMEPLS